jgi:serine/threonine protein kinase
VIDSVIGRGGMGVVYGAQQPRIGKRVAIKVLAPAYCGDPATVARFEQEGRLVNAIGHPGIVDVFQFGELPDGRSYFVMEWLDGESLGARLERGPLPAGEAIEILDLVCDALEAAHDTGVIHRDLKPDNIFLVASRGGERVKLLDFGLAKLAGRGDPGAVHATKSGILVGTPAYMSPEQARAREDIDHRTDIYALGCVAYRMLTGKPPFHADNAMDMIVKQLHQPPPAPAKLAPDTPPPLSRLVVRMMAKLASERPTLAELRQQFAELRDADDDSASAPPRSRHRGLAVLAGALLVVGSVLLVLALDLVPWGDDAAEAPAAAPAAPATSPLSPPAPETVEPVIEFEPDPVDRARARVRTREPTPPEPVRPAEPAPANGRILLMLDKAAQIELDGQIVGHASRGGTFEVGPGTHTLVVKAPGRQAVTRRIEVEAGATAVLRIADAPTESDDEGEPTSSDRAPSP